MRGPNGEKRSGNPVARAVQVGRIATGEDAEVHNEATGAPMGTFEVQIGIGRPQYPGLPGSPVDGESLGFPGAPDWLEYVSAMVDTGATHTVLPASLLDYVHIPRFPNPMEVCLADGRKQEWDVGMARIVCGSNDMPCYVIFGSEDVYLLGATTLEAFGLMVDPVDQVLVPKVRRARPF